MLNIVTQTVEGSLFRLSRAGTQFPHGIQVGRVECEHDWKEKQYIFCQNRESSTGYLEIHVLGYQVILNHGQPGFTLISTRHRTMHILKVKLMYSTPLAKPQLLRKPDVHKRNFTLSRRRLKLSS